MTTFADRNNPQILVISCRDANGDLQKAGTFTVDYTVAAGKETATLSLIPEPGMVLTGFTAPVTLALPA